MSIARSLVTQLARRAAKRPPFWLGTALRGSVGPGRWVVPDAPLGGTLDGSAGVALAWRL
ncbi:hypothetical protein GCM10010980_10440 [Corynebacterium marinum]|nr:hypothetical protein GCM10010980_10440 [Corynebacterium marinum]